MSSCNVRPGTDTVSYYQKFPMNLQYEDSLEEEEYMQINKRPKSTPPFNQRRSTGNNELPIPPPEYNPLDEPSPLGLQLRKSPSLMDLIQLKLSQSRGNASPVGTGPSGNLNRKDVKGNTISATCRLKASTFSASLLRIGRWEYVARYEADLVAKCYFAKHKLVWEIFYGDLKSKIEIQWSDIMALKANCPDDGPGTLIVVLARQPLFCREINPQPRKHTIWQETADFTDGEASIHRKHFLQCPQGVLNKHYEKLIQCDMRLKILSQQPEIVLDSPYFEARGSVFEDPNGSKDNRFNEPTTGKGSLISGFYDVASPSAAQFSSLMIEQDILGLASRHLYQEALSPCSGIGSYEGNGFKGQRNSEHLTMPGLFGPVMSMSDLVKHVGHCISGQTTCGNPPFGKALECQDMLEDIAQILLTDTQSETACDDKSLMSRINSLHCLLQDQTGSGNSPSEKTLECQDMLENIARMLLSDDQFATACDGESLMSKVNSLCCLLQNQATVPISHVDHESRLDGTDDGNDVLLHQISDSVDKNKA